MSASAVSARPAGEARIELCVGCGGVGKTTVAAALALAAARRGKRTLVLTIDPANRLADALGVRALGNQPQAIPRAALERLGVPPQGSLYALMLDMKRTFDDLVERFAESSVARERILRNPIYQHVSEALSGSIEYSAMEKVYELAAREEFERIVVDTPPSQHALDFLDAPQRLVEFLDSRLVHVLIHPAFAAGRFGLRLFHRGTHRVLHLIERISGIGFLEDISEFLLAFEGMAEGFRTRAERARQLLLGPDASFVLIATPERQSAHQALEFLERLEALRVPLTAVVANRVRSWQEDSPFLAGAIDRADLDRLRDALAAQEADGFPAEDAARAALRAVEGYAALVRRDEAALRELRSRAAQAGWLWRVIPELPEDVRDLEGLAQMGRFLSTDAPREAPSEPDARDRGAAEPA
jgi:anion-transporting  ArsA/GET3 family ATPase